MPDMIAGCCLKVVTEFCNRRQLQVAICLLGQGARIYRVDHFQASGQGVTLAYSGWVTTFGSFPATLYSRGPKALLTPREPLAALATHLYLYHDVL